MKIWAKTKEFFEGKYLVVRRDGTIPAWPHFVMGGNDPCVPNALRTYANEAEEREYDPEFVQSVRELANEFEQRDHSEADPDAPPHRHDNQSILSCMRHENDLTDLCFGGKENGN